MKLYKSLPESLFTTRAVDSCSAQLSACKGVVYGKKPSQGSSKSLLLPILLGSIAACFIAFVLIR